MTSVLFGFISIFSWSPYDFYEKPCKCVAFTLKKKKKKQIIFLLSRNWHTHHPLSSSSRPFLSPLFTFALWPPWQRHRGCHRDGILHPPGEWLCRGWWARGESLCSTTNIITITSPASRLNLRWHGHCPHANTRGTARPHTHTHTWACQHRHAANTRSERKVCPVHLTNPFCPPLPHAHSRNLHHTSPLDAHIQTYSGLRSEHAYTLPFLWTSSANVSPLPFQNQT